MCPGAGKIFSAPSCEDRDDQRGSNGVKLDGQLRHQQDEHGGGGGDHLYGPQGGHWAQLAFNLAHSNSANFFF